MPSIYRYAEIFTNGRKCIVNADGDGLIAGMLLQKFLGWRVVGYSSCCGKPDDELWLENAYEKLEECVFVDLPVCVSNYFAVDQHFVLFDELNRINYLAPKNKINPNVMQRKVYRNASGIYEYKEKYPFGTAHFVLAVLEDLGVINPQFTFQFSKQLNGFDLADLIFRADRVIGNLCQYTKNCFDWADWLIKLGGHNTADLFHIAKNSYRTRSAAEIQVGNTLQSYGCKGADGDCSNLFRGWNYTDLAAYFAYLGNALGLPPLPVFSYYPFGGLWGKGMDIKNNNDLLLAEQETKREDIFSYAFVSSKRISLTYFK